MAFAKVIMSPPPPKAPPPKVEGYKLDLTPDEALAMADVIGLIGGEPNGRRRHLTAILDALKLAGVRPWYTGTEAERGGPGSSYGAPDIASYSRIYFTS